jgi:hypothetical protein
MYRQLDLDSRNWSERKELAGLPSRNFELRGGPPSPKLWRIRSSLRFTRLWRVAATAERFVSAIHVLDGT